MGQELAKFLGVTRDTPSHAPSGASKADRKKEQKAKDEAKAAKRSLEAERKKVEEMAKVSEAAAKAAEEAATRKALELAAVQAKLKAIEEENRRKEEDRKNYPVPQYLVQAVESGKVNIAVTGNSGVGKSSLINALRGLTAKDPGYAQTGTSECTMEPELFEFPGEKNNENVWDLPGAGTLKFPKETYLKTMGLRYFDVVVLATADRFTESEHMIKKELEEFKVPHFCVRNKMDAAWLAEINKEEEANEEDADDERKQELKNLVIEQTRSYFKKNYQMEAVYLVSTQKKFRAEFELERLKEDARQAIIIARTEPDSKGVK